MYNGPTSVEHYGLFHYSSEILEVNFDREILRHTTGQNKNILYL